MGTRRGAGSELPPVTLSVPRNQRVCDVTLLGKHVYRGVTFRLPNVIFILQVCF